MIRDALHVFRDRDFIETVEGWFFGVVSDLHPPDRVLAYPKYMPGEGIWRRFGVSYTRVLATYSTRDVSQAIEMVRRLKPDYIYRDPNIGEEFTYIPHDTIRRHYRCEERLRELLANHVESLEKTCIKLVTKLAENSEVKTEFFGISGSLLLKLHNPSADIDLIVYGGENFRSVVEASYGLQKPSDRAYVKNTLVRNFMAKYPISSNDAEKLAQRCMNRGVFEETFYSLHAVRLLAEINQNYGERVYRTVGERRARLCIVDEEESIFNPAIYQVEEVESIDERVEQLVCYDTSFAGLFHEGDAVEAYGKIEKVEDRRQHREYYIMLVGSVKTAGREFIRLI